MKNCKLFKMNHAYRIFLMVLLMFLCGRSFALGTASKESSDKPEPAKYLWVWQHDGGTVSFPIADRPRITVDFEGSKVNCLSKKQDINFDLKEVKKYSLSVYPNPEASIEESVIKEGIFNRDASTLFFNNFKEGTPVYVYNLNGVVLNSYRIDNTGSMNLSTTGWGNGIYLIKVGNITYKITVK